MLIRSVLFCVGHKRSDSSCTIKAQQCPFKDLVLKIVIFSYVLNQNFSGYYDIQAASAQHFDGNSRRIVDNFHQFTVMPGTKLSDNVVHTMADISISFARFVSH